MIAPYSSLRRVDAVHGPMVLNGLVNGVNNHLSLGLDVCYVVAKFRAMVFRFVQGFGNACIAFIVLLGQSQMKLLALLSIFSVLLFFIGQPGLSQSNRAIPPLFNATVYSAVFLHVRVPDNDYIVVRIIKCARGGVIHITRNGRVNAIFINSLQYGLVERISFIRVWAVVVFSATAPERHHEQQGSIKHVCDFHFVSPSRFACSYDSTPSFDQQTAASISQIRNAIGGTVKDRIAITIHPTNAPPPNGSSVKTLHVDEMERFVSRMRDLIPMPLPPVGSPKKA